MNSYLLYLWQDGLPSGHRDVFLQRGHIAGWVVNSLFSVIVCDAFLSRWNGLSSKSLFYSLESCRTLERVLLCHCTKKQARWVPSNLHLGAELACTWIDPYLQHSWNVLSGRPSDSDFVWTISHTAEVSQSGKENSSDVICVILVTKHSVQMQSVIWLRKIGE